MKKWILLFAFAPLSLFAQSTEETDQQAVIKTIEVLFDAMRAGDSTQLKAVFMPDARMMTTYKDRSGVAKVHLGNVQEFANQIGTPHDEVYDEKIWSYDIEIDGLLATAWTEYTFFIGEQQLHCGVNAFQLFKSDEGWKIIHITDTRRNEGCQSEAVDEAATVNTLMDAWHKAAATADEDFFFGSMTSDGIYIGTDASERWLRDDMKAWAQPYFDGESAWAFTATAREVYFSGDGRTAWFEESLDTWMGVCRASGVLEKVEGNWKIAHYHLSVTGPNEKIDGFLELVGVEKKKKKE